MTQFLHRLYCALNNILDWIEINADVLVALGAIGAAIFAGIAVFVSVAAFRQTKAFKQKEEESRAAYIAPTTDPGFLDWIPSIVGTECLRISLQNYGTNSATKMVARLWGTHLANIDGEYQIVDEISIESFARLNPLPNSSTWIISLDMNSFNSIGITDRDILVVSIHYLILIVEYTDMLLNKKYDDTFVWNVNYADGGKLVEVKHDELAPFERLLSRL